MPIEGGEGMGALPDMRALAGTTLLSALDAAGVAVIITRLEPRSFGPVIRYVNAAFERMTGYAADEVVGRSPRLLQGPLTDRCMSDRLKAALRDGSDFKIAMANRRKSGDEYRAEWTIAPIRNRDGASEHWIALLRDLSHDRPLRRYFASELQHRTRNLLATVRSIAARTLAATDDVARFAGRLAALGRVQGFLGKAEKDETGVDLDALLRAELAAHDFPPDRVTIAGEPVSLPLPHVEILGLAFHELAINARDHGALASPEGVLAIGWSVRETGGERRLMLEWIETGAEPLKQGEPGRGYGRELIENALPFSLGARSRVEFDPTGLWCRIDIPLPAVGRAAFGERTASMR